MKSWFFGAIIFIAIFSLSGLFADCNICNLDRNHNGIYEEGEVDPCQEYISGKASCCYPVTRFKKCTYCTKRCVCEPYMVRKKCCRYVDQYYTKTFCRQVPQYFTQTFCRKVPEYYYVDETKYCKKYVTDTHCYYQPYCYNKTMCCDLCGENRNESAGCNACAE